jgi:beta-carotene 15,15'-dioxygenase
VFQNFWTLHLASTTSFEISLVYIQNSRTTLNMISQSIVYLPYSVSIGAIAMSNLLPATFKEWSSLVIVISIIFFGIPHGSLDLFLYSQITTANIRPSQTTLLGAANYCLIMALWTLAWIFSPNLAFWAFILLSIYHFGESDLDYIPMGNAVRHLVYLSRGALLIGMTMTRTAD